MEKNESKLDRELIELLNELRVALPGVQVLFAFLLTVPFAQRFASVTEVQKTFYFIGLMCAAAASIFLIAPSANHRIQWRDQDKEHLLQTSNKLAIAGMAFLAAAMTCVTFVISDVLYGGGVSIPVTILLGILFAFFWYLMPLRRKRRPATKGGSRKS